MADSKFNNRPDIYTLKAGISLVCLQKELVSVELQS